MIQSASFLKNQSVASFCILHEISWLKFSLQHWLSWWALVNSYTLATDEGSNILVLKLVLQMLLSKALRCKLTMAHLQSGTK